ncbi:MAG: DUF624 domain-containing protein [Clostridia bacterium]|nr:DUF624 domain-containing protein [Clostridia bacterium]
MSEKKRFNIFDWYFKGANKDNDKLDVNALEKPNIANFFKVLWKKLGKLLSANLIFVFGNFPLFFIFIALSGFLSETASAPLYQSWGPVYGATKFENTAETSVLSNLFGIHTETTVVNTPTIVFFVLGALVIFTLGFTKIGTTYIYRNVMSGEAVFPLSDFFYVVKRNLKQALILGIIDTLFIGMFCYNIYVLFNAYGRSTMDNIMFFFTIAMLIVYSFIRNYAYIMTFTFDLKLKHIIKNSVFFVILGIKRNLMAMLGVIAVILLNYALFVIFMPLGVLLPFIITIAICDFIGVYASYPVILQYMVDEKDRKRLIYKIDYDDEEADYSDLNEDTVINTDTNSI